MHGKLSTWLFCLLVFQDEMISVASAASFDCAKAKLPIEKLICSERELSALDSEMSDLFLKLKSSDVAPPLLKEEQREWLDNRRNDCDSVECAKAAYKRRIDELTLGLVKVSEPTEKEIADFCDAVVRGDIITFGSEMADVNNDGAREQATIEPCGSSGAACRTVIDAHDDIEETLLVPREAHDDAELAGGHGIYGMQFAYRHGRTYTVHFSDGERRFPQYATYWSRHGSEYGVCKFSNVTIESVKKGPAMCSRLVKGSKSRPDYVPYMDGSADDKSHVNGVVYSASVEVVQVDFDNDGDVDSLRKVEYGSGGSGGCNFSYFDIVADKEVEVRGGAVNEELLKMQGIAGVNFDAWPTCAGNDAGWVVLEGRTYFESRLDEGEPYNEDSTFHHVAMLVNNKVETVCEFEFQKTTTVERVMRVPNL